MQAAGQHGSKDEILKSQAGARHEGKDEANPARSDAILESKGLRVHLAGSLETQLLHGAELDVPGKLVGTAVRFF